MKRFAILALVLTILTACGPVPQPFKLNTSQKTKAALASTNFVSGVRVLTLEELPPGSGDVIAETLAEELRQLGIVASTSPAMRNARLLKPTVFTDVSGAWVRWELFEPDGRIRESVVTPLPRPDDSALRTLEPVVDTVRLSLTPEGQKTPVTRNASLGVGEITGAPGDGAASLAKAATVLFTRAGLDLALNGADPGLLLNAAVSVRSLDAEWDMLKLDWSIVTDGGEEVGRLSQENPVPKDALAEKWGRTAFDAVYGLVESVRAVQTAYSQLGS